MRVMLTAKIPVEKGNEALKNGTLHNIIETFMSRYKPEAAYFHATDDGDRSGTFYFDMEDSSQMPAITEAFFMGLNARVSIRPVMSASDLQKGLAAAFKE